jgi:hypothetical protein
MSAAPADELAAALASTSDADLVTKAYALTHKIHEQRLGSADVRAQRDLLTAEILRRMAAGR